MTHYDFQVQAILIGSQRIFIICVSGNADVIKVLGFKISRFSIFFHITLCDGYRFCLVV